MVVAIVMGVPQVRWMAFVRENPILKWMNRGTPMTQESLIWPNTVNKSFFPPWVGYHLAIIYHGLEPAVIHLE